MDVLLKGEKIIPSNKEGFLSVNEISKWDPGEKSFILSIQLTHLVIDEVKAHEAVST
jgi:hypothetical protein